MDGIHVSAAGGLAQAVQRIEALGATAAQVFLRSPRSYYRAAPITDEDAEAMLGLTRSGVAVIAHAPYPCVITLPPDDQRTKLSLACLAEDLADATRTGMKGVVVHPGSMYTEDQRRNAVINMTTLAESMGSKGARLLLENTATLTALHADCDVLAEMVEEVGDDKFGICLDTAHAYAADKTDISVHTLTLAGAVHFNNSIHPRGSGRDGHRHLAGGVERMSYMREWYTNLRIVLPRVPFVVEGGGEYEVEALARWNPVPPAVVR